MKALQALCTLWLPQKTQKIDGHGCFTNNDKKNFPLKQNLTGGNYGVYVATCNVLRYIINNVLAKAQTYLPVANPTKVILLFLTHFTNALLWVMLRCSTNGVRKPSSFSENNYSETTYFPVLQWLQLMFGFTDLNFILEFVWNLCSCFSLSIFTRKYCLQFSGLCLCSVTLTWNRFLVKKIQIDSLVSLMWRVVTRIQTRTSWIIAKLSRASDAASPNFWRCQIFLTLSEEQYLVWCKTAQSTKWKDMSEACKETMSPLAAPMNRTLWSDSSKAWSNLTSLKLLIRTW